MFRKKRMLIKSGYKLVTIKKDEEPLHKAFLIWYRFYAAETIRELEIVGGPTIPIITHQYDAGRAALMKYVSEHADVAIWVPERYLSSIDPTSAERVI